MAQFYRTFIKNFVVIMALKMTKKPKNFLYKRMFEGLGIDKKKSILKHQY